MKPGETFFGYDFGNHLWIVLSAPTEDGKVALANLTTHGRPPRCGSHCVVIRPGEHPYPQRDSCVHYIRATLGPAQPLDEAKERRQLQQHAPLSAELLHRVQDGALKSRFAEDDFKAVIRATLSREGE